MRPKIADHADENIGFEVFCAACKRDAYIEPQRAVALFGGQTAIKDAEKRLVCSVCGTTGRDLPGVLMRMSIHDFYSSDVNGVARPRPRRGPDRQSGP